NPPRPGNGDAKLEVASLRLLQQELPRSSVFSLGCVPLRIRPIKGNLRARRTQVRVGLPLPGRRGKQRGVVRRPAFYGDGGAWRNYGVQHDAMPRTAPLFAVKGEAGKASRFDRNAHLRQ